MNQFFYFFILLFCTNCALSQKAMNERTGKIENLVKEAFLANPTMTNDIHSLIVYEKNNNLYTEYFNGFSADSLNNLKSITKSMLGLLVGIAMDQGAIKNLQQPVINFFDECELSEKSLADKKNITIEQLLLMQAGIAWNNRALIKDDWWFHESPHCFLLDEFPMDTLPGTKFSYNSAVAHLLSGVLSRATGQSTLSFANENLFEPLQITSVAWGQDRAGEYYGNSELYLKPEDLLKIGQMLLNDGSYNGQQIIAKEWIKKMTGKAQEATALMNYGYLWMTSKDDSPFFYFAGGSGGQHLFIVPEKDLIVITTGHWDNARSTVEIMQLAVSVINQL